FHIDRIARHAKTEQPENEPREYQPTDRRLRRSPVGVREVLAHDAKQIEHADDSHQARVLEEPDEGVDDAWDYQPQRLRQYHQAHRLPVTEADRRRSLILPPGDR